MNERIEKRREFIINTAYFSLIAVIVYLCFKYVAGWIMPFIIGFAIAFMSRPTVNMLCKIPKMNRKFAALLVLIVEYALIIFLVWTLGSSIYSSIKDLFVKLPTYYDNTILPFLDNTVTTFEDLASRISPETLNEIYAMLENMADSIRGFILKFSSNMVTSLAGMTKKIPFFFISFVFTILASLFIALDYDNIITFLKNQMPRKGRVFLSDAKLYMGKTIWGYIRAYAIILVITFSELAIGLSILKIENALGIAAIVALADILPVVGTGGILIPWAIIAFIGQNFFLAIGLIVLYVVILVVRNFTEPKIIGDQLGLSPIVTIVAIYLGYRFMGFFGMILLPVVTNILVGLQKVGKIRLWKD